MTGTRPMNILLRMENQFYRFSFFTRNVNFKEAYGAIFESIVETLKIY